MNPRYRIGPPMEAGPDIKVYRATDRRHPKRRLVFRQISWDSSRPEGRRRVEESLARRRNLAHPGLVRVFDLAFRGRKSGLISEFIQGEPLFEAAIAEGPTSLQTALRTTETLAFLHRRGILCGALHPSRLFRTPNGDVVYNLLIPTTDEDLSKEAVRYASPQFLTSRRASRSGDLYWLGMILFRIFTAERPFLEEDTRALRQKQLMAYPPHPRKLNADIPEEISQLILALIQKDPDLRPPSADYVLSLLRSRCRLASQAPGPMAGPLRGRDSELERLRLILDDYQTTPSNRSVLVEGAAGVGKSRLLRRFELMCRVRRLEPVVWPGESAGGATGPQVVICRDGRVSLDRFSEALSDAGAPTLLAIERRSEDSPAGDLPGSSAPMTRIRLNPLANDQMRRVMRGLLGPHSTAFSNKLVGTCAGNPFYLVEVLEQMRRSGELRFRWGRWRWPPQATLRRLPRRLRRELTERFRALPRPQRRLLELLSLTRQPLALQVAADVLSRPAAEIEDASARLRRCGWVRLVGGLATASITIADSWMARVVRSTQGPSRHCDLHRRIALQLEGSACPHASAVEKGESAWHWILARDLDGVKRTLWPAVKALEAESQGRQAADLLKAAWTRFEGLDEWPLLRRLLKLLYQGGRLEECIRLGEARLSEGRSAPPSRQAFLYSLVGRCCLLRGDTSRAIDALGAAMERLDTLKGAQSPQIDNEVRGEYLGSLCYQGQVQKALRLARQLAAETWRRRNPSYEKVCHALFLYSHYVQDRTIEAIEWETRSVRLAYRLGRPSRAAGRLVGIALLKAEIGDLGNSRRYLDFLRRDDAGRRHPEIEAFGQFASCLIDRLEGRHQKALHRLRRLLSTARGARRNLNLSACLFIEMARNYNQLLQPERALECLQACRRVLQAEYKYDDALDLALSEAWSHALVGQWNHAENTLQSIDWSRAPRKRASYRLLRSRLYLLQQRPRAALAEAETAAQTAERGRPAFEGRCDLTRAECRLQLGQPDKARPLAQRALRRAQEHFFLPQIVEALLLRGRIHRREGQDRRALSCFKRALMRARQTDNPILLAQAYRQLGRRAAALESDQADGLFSRALLILKERLLYLSESRRLGFSRLWIESLEEDRRAIDGRRRSSQNRYLVQLRRFGASLRPGLSGRELGELLLETVTDCIPASGNVFFRSGARGSFQLTASQGRCLRSGRHLLERLESSDSMLVGIPPPPCGPRPLAVRLTSGSSIYGLIYLELQDAAVTEEEIDFLLCMSRGLEYTLDFENRFIGSERGLIRSDSENLGIVGQDPLFLESIEQLKKIAPGKATVLLWGESGTGKELFARALHRLSPRRSGPFVAVNCSGMPDSLIEAEFFGFTKGSFSGAGRDKKGLFEAANRGTLFLDEIADMPGGLQQSLLRALQERRVRRIGDNQERSVDVRIVSATNQPLQRLVAQGGFRRDLYHRLNVCPLTIPPLRRRPADILPLCRHFLEQLERREGHRVELAAEAIDLLMTYDFPGNVRELENLLESAFYLCRGNRIEASDLRERLAPRTDAGDSTSRASEILDALICGREDFWTAVRGPFLDRDLSRGEVREVVAQGLARCQGHYRRLLGYFNLPPDDYRRFLGFLANHDCKVDFRPFRRKR